MATKVKGDNPLKKRRIRVIAHIPVAFAVNVPTDQSDEEFSKEIQLLIRGMAASATIVIDEIVEAGPTGRRAYSGQLVDSHGNTAYECTVVAKDKDEAKKVLAAFKKTKPEFAKTRTEVSVPFLEDAGVITTYAVGVYPETDIAKFEA